MDCLENFQHLIAGFESVFSGVTWKLMIDSG